MTAGACATPDHGDGEWRTGRLPESCGTWGKCGQGQNTRKSGWVLCHHTSTTLPMMLEPLIGPQ